MMGYWYRKYQRDIPRRSFLPVAVPEKYEREAAGESGYEQMRIGRPMGRRPLI